MLKLAFEWEVIARRPAIHELSGANGRNRVLSFGEEEKYLRAAGTNLNRLTILAVDTGLRPQSELFCLEWAQIELTESELFPYGYIAIEKGKTRNATRTIPLTVRAREVLHILRMDPLRRRWVFPGPGNSGHLISIQKSHRKALGKAGIEQFPFYCWRHTFGTRCAQSGMDRYTVAALMGHSSPRLTERYYIHVTRTHVSSGFRQLRRIPGPATSDLAAGNLCVLSFPPQIEQATNRAEKARKSN
jgi:integrase